MKNFRHRHSRVGGNGDMASFFGCTVSLNLIRCQTAKGRLKTRSGFSDGLSIGYFEWMFLAVRRHIVAVDKFVFVGVA